MKPVAIDFNISHAPRRLAWLIALVLLVAAAGLGIAAYVMQRETAALLQERSAALRRDRTDSDRAAQEVRSRQPVPPPPYAAHALSALRQQTFPLNTGLTALETVEVIGVRVISVDVAASEGTARVQVEFASYDALLKYLSELNAGEPVPHWVLVSAQSQATASGGPATALLLGTWNK